MHILTITVTNNPDPTCQRLKLTKRFEIEDIANIAPFVRECITYVESFFKEIFPRGMTYPMPYTEVDVNEIPNSNAERLLRQAYASGQLEGTIIGDMLLDYFDGVKHTEIKAEPYGADDTKLAPSEEDAITNRMDAEARRRADAKTMAREMKPTRHTGNERTYPVDPPSDKPRDTSYVVDES
jgi:hypothetical protein